MTVKPLSDAEMASIHNLVKSMPTYQQLQMDYQELVDEKVIELIRFIGWATRRCNS